MNETLQAKFIKQEQPNEVYFKVYLSFDGVLKRQRKIQSQLQFLKNVEKFDDEIKTDLVTSAKKYLIENARSVSRPRIKLYRTSNFSGIESVNLFSPDNIEFLIRELI